MMISNELSTVALVAITKQGIVTAKKLLSQMPDSQLFVPAKLDSDGQSIPFVEPLKEKLSHLFQRYDGLVLFMAMGIAIRILAPHLKSKLVDPAVVVVDDKGEFAISALSGHKGGANELARQVARILGGQAIITTASDVIKTISLDLLGKEWEWQIEGEGNLTQASAALVNGEPVAIFQDAGELNWWTLNDVSGEEDSLPWPENITLVFNIEEMLQGNFAANVIITDRILLSETVNKLKNVIIYRPKSLVLGIGCKRGTPVDEIEKLAKSVLLKDGLSYQSIRNLASIDIKNDEVGLLQFASKLAVPAVFYSKKELDAVNGHSGVCEPAALLSSGANSLLVKKQKTRIATVAVARITYIKETARRGKLNVVGLGPGDIRHLTKHVRDAIRESQTIVGYKTYLELITEIIADKEIFASGMMEEIKRANLALDLAQKGKTVALVSSGDAGIYGMAGLVWEVIRERGWQVGREIDLEIMPGVSALNAAASLLGAPLSQDFAVISLSDLLVPWASILERIEASAKADMVLVLYNPRSQQRVHQIEDTHRLLTGHRSTLTPVGIVTNAYRKGQRIIITDLAHMLNQEIGMLTTIIVGNSKTFIYENRMVTPRGYPIEAVEKH